jgi:hypothetical protein
MRASLIIGFAIVAAPSTLHAQHKGHAPPPQQPQPTPQQAPAEEAPTPPHDETQHDEMKDDEMKPRERDHEIRGALDLPMSRVASGTAWIPDDTPMRAYMTRSNGWHLMLHGNVFAGYDYQGTDAGDEELVSQNWIMGMAMRPLGGGHFMARTMLSLEPLTVGKSGYPLLLQSGEAVDGMALVDRQHPHDLFMEIAAAYERPITDRFAFQLYGALAGEPALGPPGFPHRPSAMTDPLAPLGHHWQDSTHIAFGVLTAGLFTRTVKVEGSWFQGREPDDERYDLDLGPLDSGSARITVNPNAQWSAQVSAGYLNSPEELEPDVDVVRTTASIMNTQRFGRRFWTSTVAWGRNTPDEGPATDSVLAESALDLHHLGVTFARAEYVAKTGHDLVLDPAMDDEKFDIAMFTLGHSHAIFREGGLETSLGIRGSVAVIDADLETRYGTQYPLGVMAYVQVQPEIMRH